MYLFTALLVTFVSAVLAAPDQPLVTLAPISPTHENLVKHRMLLERAQQIQARQSSGDLSFCYGTNAICDESNQLFSNCDAFENEADLSTWYKCICENGYVSTREACHWCDLAYNISDLAGPDVLSEDSSICSSYSFTIAPVPSSVIALQSSYNATYTGDLITGGGPANTRTGSGQTGSATMTGSGSATARNTSSKKSSVVSTSTFTLDGGGVGATTPTSTAAVGQTSATTTPSGASGKSSAQGWKTGAAALFSGVAFGLSVLCLI